MSNSKATTSSINRLLVKTPSGVAESRRAGIPVGKAEPLSRGTPAAPSTPKAWTPLPSKRTATTGIVKSERKMDGSLRGNVIKTGTVAAAVSSSSRKLAPVVKAARIGKEPIHLDTSAPSPLVVAPKGTQGIPPNQINFLQNTPGTPVEASSSTVHFSPDVSDQPQVDPSGKTDQLTISEDQQTDLLEAAQRKIIELTAELEKERRENRELMKLNEESREKPEPFKVSEAQTERINKTEAINIKGEQRVLAMMRQRDEEKEEVRQYEKEFGLRSGRNVGGMGTSRAAEDAVQCVKTEADRKTDVVKDRQAQLHELELELQQILDGACVRK